MKRIATPMIGGVVTIHRDGAGRLSHHLLPLAFALHPPPARLNRKKNLPPVA